MKKDLFAALIIVAVIIATLIFIFPSEGAEPVYPVGTIVYSEVNFRTEPDTSNDGNIICQIHFGETVDVLEQGEEWTKVRYNGKEGYIINESVSVYKIIIDVSDYNWGSEYDSVDSFKAFIERAQSSTNFAGVYIQVQRTLRENAHWKELTVVLDEMDVPYGLYVYSGANTKSGAEKEYKNFLKLIEGVELKNNIYPLMLDVERNCDQSEVVKFYNGKVDDLIVYANASDMVSYGYYKLAPNYWVAHYDMCQVFPTKDYDCYDKAYTVLSDASLWQFTREGNAYFFGTTHLDVNVVSYEWYEKYSR